METRTELWKRINKALSMIYEEGFNAYPLEREAIDQNAQGVLDALDENFVFIDPCIREYLDEVRFCCGKLISGEYK